MTQDQAIATAKKLKALATKSEGGEKYAASEKLKSFCLKHDLDPDDFSVDTVRASISYANEQERTILSSVMCMVMETDKVRGTNKDNVFSFECTTRQLENITDAYKHYKKVYYDYVDAFLMVMIVKNEIGNTKKTQEKEFKFDDEPTDVNTETSASSEPPPSQSDESDLPPPPSPPTKQAVEDEIKKQQIIQKMLFIVDPSPWKAKSKVKFFLS